MKIVFISTILPSGHFSQYITTALNSLSNNQIIIYIDKNPKNLQVKNCGTIKLVWSKSIKYISQIVKEVWRDKPDVIHLQHELNMYGGILTASLFPILLLILRLMGQRLVVTIHAAVYKKQVTPEFIYIFGQDPKKIKPLYLIIFFNYIYHSISLLSHQMIVHTHLTKKILTSDYGVDAKRVNVVPIAIPQKKIVHSPKSDYFFYFGYMVRRKGLGFALDGFKTFIEKNPKSKYRFILAGGVIKGQEQAFEEIKDMIKNTGLSKRIILKGFIEQKEQDNLYENAYVVVIPAVLSMGSSGPFFHANSYGKCTIASKIGHFLEDIDNLKTGILTENDQWAKAFSYVATHPKVVREIENNVEKKALSRSPIITAKKYLTIYAKA